jgi:hypothetical protein
MSDRGLQMALIERNQVIEKLDYEPQLNMERAMAPPPKRRAELCRCILRVVKTYMAALIRAIWWQALDPSSAGLRPTEALLG